MRVGLVAAAEAGASHVTAGNYGGDADRPHPSARADAVTLTLTLRAEPDVPLDAEVLTPDRLAGAQDIGRAAGVARQRARAARRVLRGLGSGDDVRFEGDLRRVRYVGAGMTIRGGHGRRRCRGPRGAAMGGGALPSTVTPATGPAPGCDGGTLVVRGSAGSPARRRPARRASGHARRRDRRPGDAGERAGEGLRRGLIAIGGRAGRGRGVAHAGRDDRRARRARPRRARACAAARSSRWRRAAAATFAFSCLYRPESCALPAPAARARARRLRELDGRYARWCGDGLELRRGEILILEDA